MSQVTMTETDPSKFQIVGFKQLTGNVFELTTKSDDLGENTVNVIVVPESFFLDLEKGQSELDQGIKTELVS